MGGTIRRRGNRRVGYCGHPIGNQLGIQHKYDGELLGPVRYVVVGNLVSRSGRPAGNHSNIIQKVLEVQEAQSRAAG